MLANTDQPVFTFEVGKSMNKEMIKKYLKENMKVDVLKIKIITGRNKSVKFRGISGKKAIIKKAVVTLKVGQKIDELIVEKDKKKDKKANK